MMSRESRFKLNANQRPSQSEETSWASLAGWTGRMSTHDCLDDDLSCNPQMVSNDLVSTYLRSNKGCNHHLKVWYQISYNIPMESSLITLFSTVEDRCGWFSTAMTCPLCQSPRGHQSAGAWHLPRPANGVPSCAMQIPHAR